MSRYAWVITKDHLADTAGTDGTDAKGTAGPRGATEAELALATQGAIFRMKDDDGEVYYTGRFWAEDLTEPITAKLSDGRYGRPFWMVTSGGEELFGPLWDFGEPNAGCTSIEYKVRITDEDGDPATAWAAL